LHDIEIDKIAAVDHPCQELALAAIAKVYEGPDRLTQLAERLAFAKRCVARLRKARPSMPKEGELPEVRVPKQPESDYQIQEDRRELHGPVRKQHRFEAMVDNIRKRDACSRTNAMQSARREYPALFDEFRAS
jgi:hypothetical protein